MLVEKYTVFKSNISFETSGQAIEFVCARIYSFKGWGSLLVLFIVLRLFNVSIPVHCNPLLRLSQRFSFLVMFRRLEVKSILISTLSLPWCLRIPKASIICMLVFPSWSPWRARPVAKTNQTKAKKNSAFNDKPSLCLLID